jgi:hypothetical protein
MRRNERDRNPSVAAWARGASVGRVVIGGAIIRLALGTHLLSALECRSINNQRASFFASGDLLLLLTA